MKEQVNNAHTGVQAEELQSITKSLLAPSAHKFSRQASTLALMLRTTTTRGLTTGMIWWPWLGGVRGHHAVRDANPKQRRKETTCRAVMRVVALVGRGGMDMGEQQEDQRNVNQLLGLGRCCLLVDELSDHDALLGNFSWAGRVSNRKSLVISAGLTIEH